MKNITKDSLKDQIDLKNGSEGFIKVTDNPVSSLNSEQKVILNRKGNILFNQGDIESARRIFTTTGYSDGLTRVGDIYKEKNESLKALKQYVLVLDSQEKLLLKKIKTGEKEAEAKKEAKTKVEAEPKSLRVLEVLSDKNSLKIKLNRNINEDELKNFTLNSKDSWRNVYDITGILPSKFPIPQNGISAKIRIAQKDPNTVRIVFEDAKKSQIYAQIDEKEIT